MKKLFLIDGTSFIFRAFYAIRKLSNSKGVPTNAVFGFVTMLMKVFEQHNPDYVACVFDTGEPSFRKEIFGDYKANRSAPPDELVPQFDLIQRAVQAMRLPMLTQVGVEADDVIGTLAKRFAGKAAITIVSSDKDLMQLVNDKVVMLDTMKDITYDVEGVKKKLGIAPDRVIDYLGLIGDTSDNIPGVNGIGPKTAIDLLEEFGTLEGVIAAAKDPKSSIKAGKKKDVIAASEEVALLSKKLATVDCAVKGRTTEVTLEDLTHPETFATAEFVEFLKEMEFGTLIKKYSTGVEMRSGSPENSQVKVGAQAKFETITTAEQWKNALKEMERAPVIAFDTETKGERTLDIECVGLSLCWEPGRAVYVPLRHQGATQLSPKEVLTQASQVFSRGKEIVAQNLKYDWKVFLAEGIDLGSPGAASHYSDTMLEHYLLEPEEKHGLDVLALKFLDATIGDFKTTLGDRKDFSEVPVDEATVYSGLDAWSTYLLHQKFKPMLEAQELWKLYREIEMPIAPILAKMEWDGIAVDKGVLEELSAEFSKEIEQIEKKIFSSVGTTFNLNSPKQLGDILFNKLGLPTQGKTKTGFSTDVSVLESLAPLHAVPALVLRYRELGKLKSTYVDVIPDLVEKDGRVHARFNQAVAATGRLSGSDPNLQNIPIKTEDGRRVRKAFVAAKGMTLVGADYSQVELRIIAHLAQDPALIAAFKKGEDIHRATAAEIFSVPRDFVTDEQRAAAKAINFGLIYGKTAFGLAQELGIPRGQAQKYIEAYFERYQGVKKFMDESMQFARDKKYACTLFGRKRPLKEIDNRNPMMRNAAERMAMNTPVQGTAADLMKIAMIRAHEKCKETGSRIVLQVHDELVLETPTAKAKEAASGLKEAMEGASKLSVPLDVNLGQAKNWHDL